MSVRQSTAGSSALTLRLKYQQLIVRSCRNAFCVFPVEYCDMHFVNAIFDGNARAAVEYQGRFTY